MEHLHRGIRTYINASSFFFDAHKKHPFVELCKVTLSVLALRADIERTATTPSAGANFSKRHPFAAWLSSFLTAYAGSFLACSLMAESPLKPFCNPNSLIYVTVAWYCVFYSPLDVCYRFFKKFPFNSVLIVCAEIYRCGNIQSGVKYAMKSSLAKDVKLKPVLMILIGCVKGCGGSLARGIIRLVRSASLKSHRRISHPNNTLLLGASTSVDNEFQSPSFFSKVSFLAAAVFTGYWLSAIPPQFDYAMIHVSVHFFFISQRLLMSMAPDVKSADPFATLEHYVCLLLFGKETPVAEEGSGFEGETEEESSARAAGGEGGAERPEVAARRRAGRKED